MDITILTNAGLTAGEAKVYLALLELGSTTTGKITQKSKVAKSMIYPLLEKLIKKGLASYIVKEKTKYFQAARPKKLLEYVDVKKRSVEESKHNIQRILPQLELLQKTMPKTAIQIFEGFKGVQTCFDHYKEVLKKGETMFSYGIFPQQEEKYHLYWKKHHIQRTKEGIYSKMLFNRGTGSTILKNRNGYWGCDARYMPTSVQTPAWTLIYKNVVSIFLQTEHLAIQIINKDIAKTFYAYFDEYWQKSELFTK